MKALHDLVQLGKVWYIGASSMCAWQFTFMNHVAEKNSWMKFVSMQCEYPLLYWEEVRICHCCHAQQKPLTTPCRNVSCLGIVTFPA